MCRQKRSRKGPKELVACRKNKRSSGERGLASKGLYGRERVIEVGNLVWGRWKSKEALGGNNCLWGGILKVETDRKNTHTVAHCVRKKEEKKVHHAQRRAVKKSVLFTRRDWGGSKISWYDAVACWFVLLT